MRSMPAGKHEVETLLSTILRYWTLGFDGNRGHMEIIPLTSVYMLLIFVLEYFHIYFSLRFTNKYRKELGQYAHLRDLITDFEVDYPGLAASSRAVNKLAKVVSNPNFLGVYHSEYMHIFGTRCI
jgi:hypothetical protein